MPAVLLRRLVAGAVLLLFTVLVLGYLWWGRFHYFHEPLLFVTYAVCLSAVLFSHVYFQDRLDELGLRLDNWRESCRAFGRLTLLAAAAIALLGLLIGEPESPVLRTVVVYSAFGLVQQYLLQNFLRLRIEDLLGRPKTLWTGRLPAALLAASLFAIYHLPNPGLVILSFSAGVFWSLLYQRYPNILCGWLSQASLSLALLFFFKFAGLEQFQIGYPGFRYEAYGGGVSVAAGYDSAGEPFIATAPGPDWGTSATIRVFSPDGSLQYEWLAFDELDFSVNVAVGELGYGPGDELVVSAGPGSGNPPAVRIFTPEGELLQELSPEGLPDSYGAFASVGCGSIFVSPGPGPGHPQIVYELGPGGREKNRWEIDLPQLFNGIRATCLPSDSRGSGLPGLLVWATSIPRNPALILIRNSDGSWSTPDRLKVDAFGINATPVWLEAGEPGVAVAPGFLRGYPPLVQVFDLDWNLQHEFSAAGGERVCGGTLSAVDLDGDGSDELVLGEGFCPGQPPIVRVLTQKGELLHRWLADSPQ